MSPLAQRGATPEERSGGLPVQPFTGNPDNEYFLAQNPAPEAPGGPAGGTPPNLTAFNNAYLLPQNLAPSAPGEGQVYDVPPGDENANIAPLDPFRRLHHMHVDGYLKGGLLGQAPQEQLGEPLPGTAPPPGTSVPPGLVQFLPALTRPPVRSATATRRVTTKSLSPSYSRAVKTPVEEASMMAQTCRFSFESCA